MLEKTELSDIKSQLKVNNSHPIHYNNYSLLPQKMNEEIIELKGILQVTNEHYCSI